MIGTTHCACHHYLCMTLKSVHCNTIRSWNQSLYTTPFTLFGAAFCACTTICVWHKYLCMSRLYLCITPIYVHDNRHFLCVAPLHYLSMAPLSVHGTSFCTWHLYLYMAPLSVKYRIATNSEALISGLYPRQDCQKKW